MVPPVWKRAAIIVLSAAAMMSATSPASATLALTGSIPGFTLTTVVGGFTYSTPPNPSVDYTLVSFGVAPTGNLIAPANQGPTYLFSDVDGQTMSGALGSVVNSPSGGFAMATIGAKVYGSQSGGGYYVFNSNGQIAGTIPVSGATSRYGLWGDATANRLLSSAWLSSGNPAIISIDPLSGAFNVVAAISYLADGLTVTPDGSIVYVADYTNDKVIGYSLQTSNFGTQVFTTAYLGHGSDGMGVLAGTCGLAGHIVVNNNDGTVGLIDPGTALETTIASGGNRGDYASLDTSNGTLFLSQNDQMARLKAPRGCSIGTAATAAPEPASGSAAITGLIALAALRRRRSGATCPEAVA